MLTFTGIFALPFNSSGRTVRNSKRTGTVVGFRPSPSIIVDTATSCHAGNCMARPDSAKLNCTTIVLGPLAKVSKAATNVSRKEGRKEESSW